MSWYNNAKKMLAIVLVVALLMTVVSTAQAEKPSKPGNAIQNGNDKDDTSATHVPPGQLKLGKLHVPPSATLHNLSASLQAQKNGVVDSARLTMEKRMASVKINLIIRQLEQYKKQVSHSRLGADEKAAAIALADENIAWYRQQETDIQAAESLEAVTALASDTSLYTGQLKVNMKKEAGLMACDQIDSRIASARNVEGIAAAKIAEADASGRDTAGLERAMANFSAHVQAANGYATAARTAFEGITTEDNTNNGFNEGYQQIRLADQEMNRAYVDLKEFYRLFLKTAI